MVLILSKWLLKLGSEELACRTFFGFRSLMKKL